MNTKEFCRAILKEMDADGLVCYGSPFIRHGKERGEYVINTKGHYSVTVKYIGRHEEYRVGNVSEFALKYSTGATDIMYGGPFCVSSHDAVSIYNKIMGYWN